MPKYIVNMNFVEAKNTNFIIVTSFDTKEDAEKYMGILKTLIKKKN